MFQHGRCQRGAAREDKAWTVLRLDAANAFDDVRTDALERAPYKAFRATGSDIFGCRIETIRYRTARRLRPEARPEVVSATAKQQVEVLAMCGQNFGPASDVR